MAPSRSAAAVESGVGHYLVAGQGHDGENPVEVYRGGPALDYLWGGDILLQVMPLLLGDPL
jgi:hypothetical protein